MGAKATPGNDAPSGATVRRLGYQPALNGIRAIAVLAIVAHHALLERGLPPGGAFGVTTFFVASGFLITTLLLQERATRGAISLVGFYRRRALRLLPALVVFLAGLLAYFLVVSILDSPHDFVALRQNALGAIAGVSYFTNISIGYDIGFEVPITTAHLWTLATEEQFYLLWPPLLLLATRWKLNDKWLAFGLGVGVIVLAANRFALAWDGAPVPRVKYAPDVTFDAILLGCLAGVAFVNDWLPVRDPRKMSALGGLAAILCAALILAPASNSVRYGALMPVYSLAAVVVILTAVTAPRSLVNRGLSVRPLVFIGSISYALFLWQQLLIFEVAPRLTLPVAIVLSFAFGYASYVLVEQPFLKRKRREREQLEATTTVVGSGSTSRAGIPMAHGADAVHPTTTRGILQQANPGGTVIRLRDGRTVAISADSARQGFEIPSDGGKMVVCSRCSRTRIGGHWTQRRLSTETRSALADVDLLESATCSWCRASEPAPIAV